MLDILLASAVNFDFASLLNQLDQLGFFKYILPFLLIFAVVYALSSRLDIFKENKGAALLVSFAVGLLVLQLNFVSDFFQIIFPKFGIGIALLLLALILAGSFISEEKKYFQWIFFGLGAAIFLIITILSFSDVSLSSNWWFQQYGTIVIVAIVVIVAMVLVMVTNKK